MDYWFSQSFNWKQLKLPDHPRKDLINVQNTDDNECFKRYLLRYLNPVDHNPRRITKTDKGFAKRLDFKDIDFPVKIRGIHKIEKRNSIGISVFGYENKEKYPIYVWKHCCEEKHFDLLLIGEVEKNIIFLLKISIDSCVIIYYIVENKRFCRCCLHAFIREEFLRSHIKDYFKINDKQTIKMPKKGEYVKYSKKNKIIIHDLCGFWKYFSVWR